MSDESPAKRGEHRKWPRDTATARPLVQRPSEHEPPDAESVPDRARPVAGQGDCRRQRAHPCHKVAQRGAGIFQPEEFTEAATVHWHNEVRAQQHALSVRANSSSEWRRMTRFFLREDDCERDWLDRGRNLLI